MSKAGAIQKQMFVLVGLVSAVLFAPTTMIMFFGMMPTIAANLVDKTKQKSRAISVGMMNLAGCTPFLLELWLSPAPNSIDRALNIMMQPKTIIIMYVMAGAGYAIEAAVTGAVATMMQQRAASRLKTIDTMLAELTDRWGYYVDGSVKLDDFGFPEDSADD